MLFVRLQLPVPLAVLFLMYREQLIPFCPSGTPRLLDKDELAMENQQGGEGTDVEQKEHEAGGKDKDNTILSSIMDLFEWDGPSFLMLCSGAGHGDLFSCCQNDNLRGLPVSFFMIHILGGMVLFMTDGIVVSEDVHVTKHIPYRTLRMHRVQYHH